MLATLLMYARHPLSHNSPAWVSITVPEDFLEQAEKALAEELSEETP